MHCIGSFSAIMSTISTTNEVYKNQRTWMNSLHNRNTINPGISTRIMSHSVKLAGHYLKIGKIKYFTDGALTTTQRHSPVKKWSSGGFSVGMGRWGAVGCVCVCGIFVITFFLIIYFLCPDCLTQSGVGVHCPLEDALERRLRSRRGCNASYQ